MTRVAFVTLLIASLACARGQSAQTSARARTLDVLIRGGTVVDGSGNAPYAADVGISGDRITFVGDAARARVTAARTLDARGLVVAPGFIDPHTHTLEDLSSAERHANVPYLMQGVTTVITGNDGGGPVDVAGTMRRWEQLGIGTNAALYVGQGTVRRTVLGMSDAAATAEQRRAMDSLVARAMDGGALGLSSGLYYAPGSYASTEEVIGLARVAARYGGIYDSHLRDESSYTPGGLLGAVAEAIRIGREAGMPVNISHVKALGADVWGRSDSVIALVRAARAAGQRVTADQYPYTASGTSVGASLLPRWAEAGGRDSLLWRMSDPATRARLVRDMEDNLRRRGGADALLITRSRDTAIAGRRLGEIARARGVAPVQAALDILRTADASVASFNMDERDIERFMREEWVMTGSDGSSGHPRKYGTFPRKLRVYVRERHVLSLAAAVRASSALAAETFGFRDRGHLREGQLADVVVFDEAALRDRSTYEQPELLAEGMRWVIVNGKVAVDDGRYTGVLAGRALRREGGRASAAGLTPPPPLPYDAMAARIARALAPARGERVILRVDSAAAVGAALEAPLRAALQRAGADVQTMGFGEIPDFEQRLAGATAYVWLPLGGKLPSREQRAALGRWLDSGRGREIHFHWGDGTLRPDGSPGQHSAAYDSMYAAALDIDYPALRRTQDDIVRRLRAGEVRVTTPEGTDLRFRVGDRPATEQDGDASAARMASARVRVDREVELPAGVVRVAPLEETVRGTWVIPLVRVPLGPNDIREVRTARLELERGVVTRATAAANEALLRDTVLAFASLDRFRELGIGVNPKLAMLPGLPYVPYYGYGAGVVRLSLGDNSELGGAVGGGASSWFLFPRATVSVGTDVIVRDGVLVER